MARKITIQVEDFATGEFKTGFINLEGETKATELSLFKTTEYVNEELNKALNEKIEILIKN